MNTLSRTFIFLAVTLSALPPAPARAGSIVSTATHCVGQPHCSLPPPNSFIAVAAGNYHDMGLRLDGSVATWGLCDVGQCSPPPAPNSGFIAIAASDSTSFAMRQDGSIAAWGSNEAGEHEIPQPNIGYTAMAMGLLHGLAIRADGSIVGWGHNAWGLLEPPAPNTGWVKIAAGGFRSMGLKADGTLHMWGCAPPPHQNCEVPTPNNYIDMATFNHHLALRPDGSIVAWGENTYGQINVPEPNTGFVKVAAGDHFSLGLKADGTLLAWGAFTQEYVPLPNGDYVAMSANKGLFAALRDETTSCTGDAQCSDGLFCNGTEACVSGTCQAGPRPCNSPLFCRESDGQCVSCLSNLNCDDGLFCNGAETCSASGTCLAGSNPCPGLGCSETANMCTGGPEVWLSFVDTASVPGVGSVAAQDIVARNVSSGVWSMVFDGSDVGLSPLVIDGMARMDDGSILLSFTASASIPGMTGGPSGTTLDDSDIVRFVPTSLGPTTAGSFVFYFDGSDVGLTTDNEDIDAIALTSSGQLVISTVGSVNANGASGADADLLTFNATSLGSSTAGSFAVRFDGSDVGLSDGNEDVDAADIASNGTMLLSTTGAFSVPGVSGADEDVFRFTPSTLGGATSGTYSSYLDLDTLGIDGSEDVGAVELKE